jgi:hypothetical protein
MLTIREQVDRRAVARAMGELSELPDVAPRLPRCTAYIPNLPPVELVKLYRGDMSLRNLFVKEVAQRIHENHARARNAFAACQATHLRPA